MRVDDMTRDEIVRALEDAGGYQCYDSESTEELRECLRQDIRAGLYEVGDITE